MAGDVEVFVPSTGLLGRRHPEQRRSARSAAGESAACRRFAVKPTIGGVPVRCVLRGDPSSGALRHGDLVRVTGRRHHDGTYTVRRVEVLETPVGPVSRVIRASSPFRRFRWRLVARVALGTAGLLLFLTAALLAWLLR